MSRFFIDRPIFAWVIAIVLMLAGVLAINALPIAQYPTIAQPAITITTSYPGASARTLEDTVTQVIEQKMKGLDRLAYIASTSESTGNVTITLTFETGTSPDTAQVQVQNKLALATPLLPQEVQQQGVAVNKAGNNFLAVLGFISENGQMNSSDLADYVASKVLDPLSRIDGVGDTQLFGSQYAMRIWMDPAKLDSYKLTPLDVKAALQAQNAQISAGQLGGLPAVPNQQLNASITSQTRLKTAAEFENIVLRVQTDGSLVRLSDVARIERGSESYTTVSEYNGNPAAGLLIKLATGANALQTIKAVDARVEELKPFFPPGMQVVKPYDTTPFVRLSIEEVVKTLVEAVVLVFLVMYLFLQNWRATLIPTIAVPVVLLGTFAVLAVFGYTINTLTMLAMVLAIGLLVDDAIVVVENVERVMAEEGLSPLEATRKSMDQITGALVGVALVLAAVFLPMAFFGGSSGVIYRQFSLTIISAMTLSVLVALILTPALCATLLKAPEQGKHGHGHGGSGGKKQGFLGRLSSGFFGGFNRGFDRTNGAYQGVVRHIIGRKWLYLVVYAVLVAAVVFGFIKLPAGFLPDEDQGTLYTLVQMPPGATQERTLKVLKDIQHHYLVEQKDAVASLFTVAGFSFAGGGQSSGFAFVKLKPWDERTTDELKSPGVVAKATKAFSAFRDGRVFAIAPPPVSELGNASGFDLMLQDRANLGHNALVAAQIQLLGALSQEKGLVGVRPNGQADEPQFKVTIDFDKAGAYGLSVADINETISSAWGSSYVNDYIDDGRVKKVFLQADAPFRMLPSDVDRWRVRNSAGAMVPFSSFATVGWETTSPRLERYNGVPSRELLGMALPGNLSSSQALDVVEQKVKSLPPGIGYEWTGISRQERESSGQALLLYGLSLLVVFLCLAALYESWSIPAAVLLAVPLGVLGTLVFAFIFFKLNDIYFQVGLLTTVGLTSKNAILIVEFAKDLQAEGEDVIQSALHAARLRLRPIIMTSLAFILGVLPLALGSGAGSGAQTAIGWSVIGGMLFGTVLAVVFVPLFFVVVRSSFQRGKDKKKDAPLQLPAPDGTQAIALPGSTA